MFFDLKFISGKTFLSIHQNRVCILEKKKLLCLSVYDNGCKIEVNYSEWGKIEITKGYDGVNSFCLNKQV